MNSDLLRITSPSASDAPADLDSPPQGDDRYDAFQMMVVARPPILEISPSANDYDPSPDTVDVIEVVAEDEGGTWDWPTLSWNWPNLSWDWPDWLFTPPPPPPPDQTEPPSQPATTPEDCYNERKNDPEEVGLARGRCAACCSVGVGTENPGYFNVFDPMGELRDVIFERVVGGDVADAKDGASYVDSSPCMRRCLSGEGDCACLGWCVTGCEDPLGRPQWVFDQAKERLDSFRDGGN